MLTEPLPVCLRIVFNSTLTAFTDDPIVAWRQLYRIMHARFIPRCVLQWTARFLRLFFVFLIILNQNEFRIAIIAMFTSDLNAGVAPPISPPLHNLERLRTTMVDFIDTVNRGRSVVSWTLYG